MRREEREGAKRLFDQLEESPRDARQLYDTQTSRKE